MASAYLYRTQSTPTNDKIGTLSVWVKRGGLGDYTISSKGPSADRVKFNFDANDNLEFFGKISSTSRPAITTTRVFRDTSAWYHIVVAVDTTQATASDRIKIYVNGVQETAFNSSTYFNQNEACYLFTSGSLEIGRRSDSSANFFNGCMTHFHYTDGTTYAASDFGETDSTSGIWKPKTSPSVTYGTNGFFLKMENSSDMGEDSSGNNNDFTTSGTITQTEDSPSNNFCTMNPLNKASGVALSNGNLTCVGSSNPSSVASTLAVSSGKWYWEAKLNSSSYNYFNVSILKTDVRVDNLNYPGDNAGGYTYAADGNIYNNGSASLDTGTTISVGDIVGFLLDLDNGTLKLKKNGSDVYSGNAVASSLNTGDFWYVAQGANTSNVDFNFGNGYFGTTAVSSSNSDSAGLGLFEYSVPSGYYALCTKNIKNYG